MFGGSERLTHTVNAEEEECMDYSYALVWLIV